MEFCLRCKKSPALKRVFQCCIQVLKCSRVFRRFRKFFKSEYETHLCVSVRMLYLLVINVILLQSGSLGVGAVFSSVAG
jgi:hypothetical protein